MRIKDHPNLKKSLYYIQKKFVLHAKKIIKQFLLLTNIFLCCDTFGTKRGMKKGGVKIISINLIPWKQNTESKIARSTATRPCITRVTIGGVTKVSVTKGHVKTF